MVVIVELVRVVGECRRVDEHVGCGIVNVGPGDVGRAEGGVCHVGLVAGARRCHGELGGHAGGREGVELLVHVGEADVRDGGMKYNGLLMRVGWQPVVGIYRILKEHKILWLMF